MTAADAREPLTRSIEDYLKAIYSLSSDDASVGTTDLASYLNLTPASVSGMVKRLSGQGLVEHLPYRGARLTDEGRLLALRMLRRHRLIEAYLVGFLGYTWDTVHEEAERLEHAVSDELVERMAHALGNPRVDPHGDPIPDADGTIADFIHVPLVDLESGETVTIARVDSRDEGRLRFLAAEGLVPGTELTVIDRYPYGGPVAVRVGAEERMVGRELAGVILCARDVDGEPPAA
ncbi:MAG: metal-dependent transcriptional regulator [Gemmatimonadales bacterium]